jgi:hypothetical protein
MNPETNPSHHPLHLSILSRTCLLFFLCPYQQLVNLLVFSLTFICVVAVEELIFTEICYLMQNAMENATKKVET